MYGRQTPIRSTSTAKSVSKADGQLCGSSSKSSATKIPQVKYPPRSKEDKHELSPVKDTKHPTASSTHAKKERSELNSKLRVSKQDDTHPLFPSDKVKLPKVKYPPRTKEEKRELSSVKDTKHPVISASSSWSKKEDNQIRPKFDHLNVSPMIEDENKLTTALLKEKCTTTRHRRANSNRLVKANVSLPGNNNDCLLTRQSKTAGKVEHEEETAGDSTTKGQPQRECGEEEMFSTSGVDLPFSFKNNSFLHSVFKPVISFCIENTSRISVFVRRIIIYCISKLTFQHFSDQIQGKSTDKMKSCDHKVTKLSTTKSQICLKQDSWQLARSFEKTKICHSQKTFTRHKHYNLDTSKMDALVSGMVDRHIIRNSDNPTRDIKYFFENEVKMEQRDIQPALVHYKWLREKIVGRLNSEMNFGTWKVCNAGSHFDGTKVARPNEMDCTMFPILQTKLEAVFDDTCKAGACKVKVIGDVDDHEEDLRLFLDGGFVNSKKFRKYVFEKLERVLESDRKLKDARKFKDSQSFAVRYEGIPSDEGMKSIDIDFVPSLNIKPWPRKNVSRDITDILPDQRKRTAASIKKYGFNATPKFWYQAKDPDLLWQVSFSYAEKAITKHADKISWKPSLRTLKRVLEIAKGNSDCCAKGNSPELVQIQEAVRYVKEHNPKLRSSRLTTYHIRTLMWWQLYDLTAGEHVWRQETMAARFQDCLRKFQKMMTGEIVVPHFFLPQIKNILPWIPEEERVFLYVIAKATEVVFTQKK
ncbi:uncharacterized protein LOC124133244 [Haliotis rufescens]|uniref:uncharacterized protein LOC124133244 n=1 Tax=Haliotis rufescens TaxID=6454 RepID=UPI00201F2285|nr:uncharacterized protein LOC124133244 [Haliotis rufescens]XP_048256496.1 uncharacterized protein LOC124133244 [Haliotis rufescens]